jgi:methanogenic corrinoid protein MtbC1
LRSANRESDLLTTIREQIIPQLVLSHCADSLVANECDAPRLPPTSEEVSAFARLAVAQDVASALGFVEGLVREGLSLESVLLDLVAPAARLLGDEWAMDEIGFTEVTVGLSTLQHVVHVLGPSHPSELLHRGLVLLVAAPGEQHTLGIYLLGELLRRAGWGVHVGASMSDGELLEFVSSESVKAVGISVSHQELVKPLPALIGALRRASLNAHMGIMIGGAADLSDVAQATQAYWCRDPRDAARWLARHEQPAALVAAAN